MLDIAIDVDGTLFFHRYPSLGLPIPGAFEVLKELQDAGHRLILLTMRSEELLEEALVACQENGITFKFVNANPDQGCWTSSRKVFAHHYIDDAALGCPLKQEEKEVESEYESSTGKKLYVDWAAVRAFFVMRGVLK